MAVKGRMEATRHIECIKRLLRMVPRMVSVVVDGHPAHKAKSVKGLQGPGSP